MTLVFSFDQNILLLFTMMRPPIFLGVVQSHITPSWDQLNYQNSFGDWFFDFDKRQHKFLLHYLSYLRTILQDVLPVLTELCHALNIRKELETLVEEGNFCKVELCIAFVLSIRSSSTSLSFSSYISKDNILFYLLLTKFYLIAGISSTFRIFTTSRYTFRAFSCARNEPQC